MKKIKAYMIIALLIITAVYADNMIMVLDFNYDHGKISLADKIIKPGYVPDRKLTSTQGYKFIEISNDDEILYSFTFEIPNKIFTDATTEHGEIKGNLIILNETSFALVVPYYDNIKEIKIIDEQQKEISSAMIAPKLSPVKTTILIFVLALIGIVCIALAINHLKHQNKRKLKR
jgi:hypothetical protein